MTGKRRRQGRDWHAWAFYEPGEDGMGWAHWAEPKKPDSDNRPSFGGGGKWVRVKFVPIDPLPKAKP